MKYSDITVLNEKEIENLKLQILNLSEDEIVDIILDFVDHFNLSMNDTESKAIETFLIDKRLIQYRKATMKKLSDFPDMGEDIEGVLLEAVFETIKPDGWSYLGDIGNILKEEKIDYSGYSSLSEFIKSNLRGVEIEIDVEKGIRRCKV